MFSAIKFFSVLLLWVRAMATKRKLIGVPDGHHHLGGMPQQHAKE